MNNITYNPNFTGIKLNVSKVTNNKQRWENIANIVEQRTAKTKSTDVVDIYSIDCDNGVYMDVETYARTGRGGEHQIEAVGEQLESILERPDKYIAGKIIKFVRICRQQDATYNALGNFLKKIKNHDEDFAQKITDIVVDEVVNKQKRVIEADSFLKGLNCYL